MLLLAGDNGNDMTRLDPKVGSPQKITDHSLSPLSPSKIYIKKEEKMMLFVGPEGGFSDPEVDLLLAEKSTPVMLSPFILRTETASVLLTAAVRQFLSES